MTLSLIDAVKTIYYLKSIGKKTACKTGCLLLITSSSEGQLTRQIPIFTTKSFFGLSSTRVDGSSLNDTCGDVAWCPFSPNIWLQTMGYEIQKCLFCLFCRCFLKLCKFLNLYFLFNFLHTLKDNAFVLVRNIWSFQAISLNFSECKGPLKNVYMTSY